MPLSNCTYDLPIFPFLISKVSNVYCNKSWSPPILILPVDNSSTSFCCPCIMILGASICISFSNLSCAPLYSVFRIKSAILFAIFFFPFHWFFFFLFVNYILAYNDFFVKSFFKKSLLMSKIYFN